MRNVRMKVGAGGRIVLPAEFRKELGLAPGDEVLVVLDNGALWDPDATTGPGGGPGRRPAVPAEREELGGGAD